MTLKGSKPAEVKEEVPDKPKARKITHVYDLGDVTMEKKEDEKVVVRSGTSIEGNVPVSVKVVRRAGLEDYYEEAVLNEVKILSKLNHPNIVKVLDFFEQKKHYYVVMEPIEGGELFDQIVQRSHYSEKEARDVARILANAVKYCHENNIVHR